MPRVVAEFHGPTSPAGGAVGASAEQGLGGPVVGHQAVDDPAAAGRPDGVRTVLPDRDGWASKHGQVGLVTSLAWELRERGIRVSTIAPDDVASAVVTVLQQPRRMRTALWSMWSMAEKS